MPEEKKEEKQQKWNMEQLGFPFTQGDYDDLVMLLSDVDQMKMILEKDKKIMELQKQLHDLFKDYRELECTYNKDVHDHNGLVTSQAILITNLQNKVLCGQDDKWLKLKGRIVDEIKFKTDHAKNNEGFLLYTKVLSDVLLAMNLIEKEESNPSQEKPKVPEPIKTIDK